MTIFSYIDHKYLLSTPITSKRSAFKIGNKEDWGSDHYGGEKGGVGFA